MPHDRGNLVLVLPLAEANALLEEPLAVAVGFGNAFVICPHAPTSSPAILMMRAAPCTRRS
jgi:hypothetical protein